MSKFKIGDKVKYINSRSNYIWTIDALPGNSKHFPNDYGAYNQKGQHGLLGPECNYELIEPKESKMTKINYIVLNDSIVVNFEGKTMSIKHDDGRYKEVLLAIKENRLSDIPNLVDVKNYFSQNGFEIKDGLLYVDNEALPDALSGRVLDFREQGLPFEPLLKFWENLKANPSFNSRQMLYKFLEHNGHPLTDDGCFIAYRGVTEDFKDCHTRTFDNSVGQVCEVPRASVDDNPNNTCSKGLHVACFDYANGFGAKLIEVKVNPIDVVAVPTDYNGTKMRVCKFEVVAVGEKLRTEPLYGQETETNWNGENETNHSYDCKNSDCDGNCEDELRNDDEFDDEDLF